MTWETIRREGGGRSCGVTVSWRSAGGRSTACLSVSLGKTTVARFGLVKGTKPAQRVVVQRDRFVGKLRVILATTEPREETRSVAWKGEGCSLSVPLADVTLAENKKAQDVRWEFGKTEYGTPCIFLKLPHWACPPIRVETGKAA
jgi:hypothetical protein